MAEGSGSDPVERRCRQLIFLVAQQNKDAFGELYHELASIVRGYLTVRVSDESTVNDIFQETFIAVWRNAGAYAGSSRVLSWVIAITRHKMMDALRVKYRIDRQNEELASDCVVSHEDFADNLSELLTVQTVIQRLDDISRELIHLVFQIGLSYGEVANILHIPEGTVKSRMAAIKNTIRNQLGGEIGARRMQ